MSNLAYEDYIAGSQQLLNESQKEASPYKILISEKEFVVFPNVFSPKYFGDSEFFLRTIPVKEGDDFLEIGPGTGIISIFAAYQGAHKVLAIDINPDAVKNTEENIKLHGMSDRVEVRLGSVYDPIKESEKFDIIFWNLPFGLIPEDSKISDLQKALFDPGYVATKRFILEAKNHLKLDGRLFAGFSTTLGKMSMLEDIAHEAGYKVKVLDSIDSKETHPVKFELLELLMDVK